MIQSMKFDCSKNNKDFEYLAFELNQFFGKINSLSRKTDFNMICSLINSNLLKIYQIYDIYLTIFFENKIQFKGKFNKEFYNITYRSFYLWNLLQEYFLLRDEAKPIGSLKTEIFSLIKSIHIDLIEISKIWKKKSAKQND